MSPTGPDPPLSRRDALAGFAAVAGGTLAGCLGSGSANDGDGGEDAGTTARRDTAGDEPTRADGDGATTTANPETLAGHPAAAGLADQPTLGPDPAAAEATIVAFEDPSCTRCRAFERETVPEIRSELVETGRAAFVFRGYPIVYPWGEPATQALEATYARDADAFWALVDHYFAEQPSFDTDNVFSKTEEFLAAETDLDAAAVVDDARTEAYGAAVQADLDAGMNAGAGRTTPTVFLFKDGQYRTQAAGSVSFSLVENALGL